MKMNPNQAKMPKSWQEEEEKEKEEKKKKK